MQTLAQRLSLPQRIHDPALLARAGTRHVSPKSAKLAAEDTCRALCLRRQQCGRCSTLFACYVGLEGLFFDVYRFGRAFLRRD